MVHSVVGGVLIDCAELELLESGEEVDTASVYEEVDQVLQVLHIVQQGLCLKPDSVDKARSNHFSQSRLETPEYGCLDRTDLSQIGGQLLAKGLFELSIELFEDLIQQLQEQLVDLSP